MYLSLHLRSQRRTPSRRTAYAEARQNVASVTDRVCDCHGKRKNSYLHTVGDELFKISMLNMP